jgi:hypothetical protein
MIIRTAFLGVMTMAVGALAQDAGPARVRGRFGPAGGPPCMGSGVRLMGAEAGMPGRVVKNAPYSAEIVTESSQALADGNRIRQATTVRVYRDSEGRTRRESPLRDLNGLAPNANLPQLVFISDPVAGANYALNPHDRTATKSGWRGAQGRQGGPSRMPKMERQPGQAGPGQERALANGIRRRNDVKVESLGRQVVEGVPADGMRTTMTIAAGQIGNDQPIHITQEVWFSSELQVVVLSKHSDPRSGETVTRMANVSRAEPPATLFSVPADYRINEGMRRGPAPNSVRQ